MDCKEMISIFADVLTCVSIFGSAVAYWVDWYRNLQIELDHDLSVLFDFYYENVRNVDNSELYSKRVQFMSKLNRFAEKANKKCVSKRYIRKKASIFLKQQNDAYIREYIAQRRNQFKRDDYYSELEKLMNYVER